MKLNRVKLLNVLFSCCYFSQTLALGFLSPKGHIAFEQRKLFFDTLSLMLIVVIPVIVMSIAFAYRFGVQHKSREYRPDWHDNHLLELFWWAIPSIIILILSILTWKTTHSLDPYRPLNKGPKQVIQAVALRWKWLFIYPQQGVASMNVLYMPKNTDVEFHITADAPMSAFHIPALGGQIYAMAGMQTKLHLYGTKLGIYDGMNSQLNGKGFSHMHFPAHVVSLQDFKKWITSVKSHGPLTTKRYEALYQPSIPSKPALFGRVDRDMFVHIMHRYAHINPSQKHS